MTDKELQKLSRKELLEMLISQTSEIERLKKELKIAEARLKNREIKINEAGSIAEASLALNRVFEAAQAAAEQYLYNVQNSESINQGIRDDAESEARRIIAEAEAAAAEKELAAKREAEAYWASVSERLERFYDEHIGLRELLNLKKDN